MARSEPNGRRFELKNGEFGRQGRTRRRTRAQSPLRLSLPRANCETRQRQTTATPRVGHSQHKVKVSSAALA